MHLFFFKGALRLRFLFLKHLHDFLAFFKSSFIVHGLFTISIISNGLYAMIKILNYSKYWIIHIWESDIHYSISAISWTHPNRKFPSHNMSNIFSGHGKQAGPYGNDKHPHCYRLIHIFWHIPGSHTSIFHFWIWIVFFMVLIFLPIISFSWLTSLNSWIGTCIILVDVLNDYSFSFFFFESSLGIGYSTWLKELMLLLYFHIGMFTFGAGYNFLELIPIIYYFVAARPSLLCVMEYWFPRMITTRVLLVLIFNILFSAPIALTF